ncbi:hypothetical protein H6G80_32435 [Nostoc sp. FACHB-87]|uniref:hypothetical protein n=1 Tax=Nostocaceae TaxID=1162 RepID=UPI001682EDBA|nr:MULTISPECIES: hypothetical protein [Nostocaceae]MBD2458757.1 hypothetical protein [Nostoc sp. FACHB-87]MBD2479796.1 hypothetical protein [Anabaena sp. FACHB-83]
MKKFSAALLGVLLATNAAYAHRDRILTLTPNGSIPEIPATFGRAHLTVSGLGTDQPLIQLKIGTHQTTLPACVARLIRTTSQRDIRLTGSWYHDESILPYYINIEFYDPGRNPNLHNSSYQILYNLHNAKIIKLTRFKANLLGNGVQSTDIVLPVNCKSVLMGT